MAPKKAETDPDDAPLKRLGGGRWQTRDERFTIEPQSGTWVVVDGEQTDDLGLPLVRGPFPSLTAAKEAISSARSTEPAQSPLAGRLRDRPEPARKSDAQAAARKTSKASRTPDGDEAERKPAGTSKAKAPEEPTEPAWLVELDPADRGRARRQIESLAKLDIDDPEGVVRRDVVGDVPAIAAEAIKRQLAELGKDAHADDVAELLADGRDGDLAVRWRHVDGEGRPIVLEPRGRARHRT
jgi:hypothetical protein